MLSIMETPDAPTPGEARAALADAEAARTTLAAGLVLPPLFLGSIGAAVAVQIATTAVGVAAPSGPSLVALVAGLALFAATAAYQVLAFRRANGVWLGGLLSRVVAGTATPASLSYAAALATATWAALAGAGWLVAGCAAAGGVAYVLSGRRWMQTYRAAPAVHGRGESALWLGVLVVIGLAGLLLLVQHR